DATLAATRPASITRADLLALVRLYAIAGRADRAAAYLAEYDKSAADTTLARPGPEIRQYLEGLVVLAQGRPADALRLLRQVGNPRPYLVTICEICLDRDVAMAFEAQRLPDSALVAYEHFANTPLPNRVRLDSELPITLRRIGEIYEQKGNAAKALK